MIGKGLLVSEGFWYVYSKITADCKYSFERGRKMLMKHNLKKNEKKKKVVFINGWRKMCSMVLIFSMAVSLGAGYVSSRRVEAKAYDTSMSQFNKQYLDTNTFTVKGEAYLVGTDNVVKIGSTQTVYSVPEGTKIQGKMIKSKYLPQDNNQTVKYIWNGSGNVVGGGIDWISDHNSSAAFLEYETTKFKVLAYDDQWVIVWSEGYTPYKNLTEFQSCKTYLVQTAHRPGFYRVKREQVWLDMGRYESTTPKDGEKVTIKAEGKTTKAFVGIKLFNGIPSWGDSYRVPINTKLQVVSTEPIESKTKGDKSKYYKIYFNGKNSVDYMTYKSSGYYYVNAKYVNLYNKDTKVPKEAKEGKVYKLAAGKELNVYEEKSTTSTVLGSMENDVTVEYFADETDDTWTTIWFNSKKAYVKSSYFSKSTAVSGGSKVTNLHIKDIVNNQYVVGWDDLYNSTGYKVGVITSCDKFLLAASKQIPGSRNYELIEDADIETNYYKVKKSCFNKRKTIDIFVYGPSSKVSDTAHMTLSAPPERDVKPIAETKLSYNKKKKKYVTKNNITKNTVKIVNFYTDYAKHQLQYSSNKNFKDAKTITKSGGNVKKYTGKSIVIKGLKPNTTYYFRQRYKAAVKTDAGTKYLIAPWSKSLKIKTLAK